jgi:hypothetical protein
VNAERDDPELHDARLRRALEHAPDQRAAPDERLREVILKQAHDAIGAFEPAQAGAKRAQAARSGWRRFFTGERGKFFRPWNAAFATVLVAVLVTTLWRDEPIPQPRSDEQAVETAPPPAAPSLPQAAPAAEAQRQDVMRSRKQMAPAPMPAEPALESAPVARPDAASSLARAEAADAPAFDALRQWDRLTITRRGGATRGLLRSEAREIDAWLGPVALSATALEPLDGEPRWRVTLERGSETLAVLEVAGARVRWREGRAPATTGAPPAPALSALREALSRAAREPPRTP